MDTPKIVIIGTGNVASHLATAFANKAEIDQIFSRDIEHARELASKVPGSVAISDFDSMNTDADLYLISVSDDAIPVVASQMTHVNGLVAHTSGSVPLDSLQGTSDRIAVIYPLQSFSKNIPVDVARIPFFTEANTSVALELADAFVHRLSHNLHHADSSQRRVIHIAAVFANNFSNHMLTIADLILQPSGYDLKILQPLLETTISKAFANNPALAQTGPAKRGDFEVMQQHIASLPPDLANIYRSISNSILDYNHNSQRL